MARPELQKIYIDGQQAQEKMFKSLIIKETHIKTTVQNITSHLSKGLSSKGSKITNVGEDVKKRNLCTLLM